MTGSLAQHNYSFPYGGPSSLYIPWVWDAIFDPVDISVRIISIPPTACRFNRTMWKEMVHLFPAYKSQLAYGLDTNIFIQPNVETTIYHDSERRGTLICQFYSIQNETFHVNAQILLNYPFPKTSTVDIICPVGSFLNNISNRGAPFTSQNHVNTVSLRYFSSLHQIHVESPIIQIHTSENNHWLKTAQPPKQTCRDCIRLSPLRKQDIIYDYNLSVCAATSRSDRKLLVEWLEYHIAMGVDHFFLYDTSISNIHTPKRKSLKVILFDYISQSFVTVIPWHYDNCVNSMAGGRYFTHINPFSKLSDCDYFRPPPAIAQTAALASCYARARRRSKYITHIDDDEFLTIPTNEFSGGLLNFNLLVPNLVDYADSVFKYNSRAPAIAFPVVEFYPCHIAYLLEREKNHSLENSLVSSKHSILLEDGNEYATYVDLMKIYRREQRKLHGRLRRRTPRLSAWKTYQPGASYEKKILMRTEAVSTFYIHYLAQLEEGWRKEDCYQPAMTSAAVHHYRVPGFLTGNIYSTFHVPSLITTLAKEVHTLPGQRKHFFAFCENLEAYKKRYRHDEVVNEILLKSQIQPTISNVKDNSVGGDDHTRILNMTLQDKNAIEKEAQRRSLRFVAIDIDKILKHVEFKYKQNLL